MQWGGKVRSFADSHFERSRDAPPLRHEPRRVNDLRPLYEIRSSGHLLMGARFTVDQALNPGVLAQYSRAATKRKAFCSLLSMVVGFEREL